MARQTPARRVRSTLFVVGAFVAILVAVVIVRTRAGQAGPDLPPDVGSVEFVIDGDTIDIEIGGRHERVRLIGIDTPETYVEDGPPECYGPEASEFMRTLLPAGTEVRLTRDVVGRDDYGRLLAYVYRRDDDLFVNEAIVAAGYARPMTVRPNDAYSGRFVAHAIAAEADDLGLWRACAG